MGRKRRRNRKTKKVAKKQATAAFESDYYKPNQSRCRNTDANPLQKCDPVRHNSIETRRLALIITHADDFKALLRG